jgi:hypothetical protein
MLRPLINGAPMADEQIRKYRSGESTSAGEKVGKIGHWSAGDHLHFGVACSQTAPTSSLGRQPLPRPIAEVDAIYSVKHFGIWYDPIPWLGALSPVQICEREYFLPRIDSNCQTLYYVCKQNSTGIEEILASDMNGQNSFTIWQVPINLHVDDILVFRNSLIAKTHDDIGGYRLSRIFETQEKLLVVANQDFAIARGAKKTAEEFVVIFVDESQPTMAINSKEWKYKPIKDELYSDNIFSFLSPSNPPWRMLGTRTDPVNNQSRIFVVTGDGDGEHRGFVKTDFECRGCVVTNSSNSEGVPADQDESIVFSRNVDGKWIPSDGILAPIEDDALVNGYSLSSYHDWDNLPNVQISVEAYDSFDRRILITVGPLGSRQIAGCNTDGSDIEVIIK